MSRGRHGGLVTYSTQYAMPCFEGLKAFPQPDGSLKLLRPHLIRRSGDRRQPVPGALFHCTSATSRRVPPATCSSLSDGRLVTPELGDTVLAGITRRTVIELAAERGIPVEERAVAIEEVLDDAVEAFGTGTAAGVTYFSSIRHGERERVFGDGAIGPVAHAFRSRLKGMQYGALENRYGWMVPVVTGGGTGG